MKPLFQAQVDSWLSSHKPWGRDHAVRALLLKILMCALSKAGFFQIGALYGESAMYFFHELLKIPDELDLCLCEGSCEAVDPVPYHKECSTWIRAFGLTATTEVPDWDASDPRSIIFHFQADGHVLNSPLRIVVNIRPSPGSHACFVTGHNARPCPCFVRMCDLPTLLADTMYELLASSQHKCIGRALIHYLPLHSHKVPVNMPYLRERLALANHPLARELTLQTLQKALTRRLQSLDYEAAKQAAVPQDTPPPLACALYGITLWGSDFFCSITRDLKEESTEAVRAAPPFLL